MARHALVVDAVPALLTVSAPGVSLEVGTDPYRVVVRDGEGHTRLQSSAPLLDGVAAESGYAPLAYSEGDTEYSPVLIPGYTRFEFNSEGWKADWRVVAYEQGESRLSVELSRGSGERIRLMHVLGPGVLRVEAELEAESPRAWSAAFEMAEDEAFLGFGERFNTTNQRGRRVWSWIEEGGIGTGEGNAEGPQNPFPSGEMMTYYAVPFFISSAGYGFWLDTSYRSEFQLGSDEKNAWRAWHLGPKLAFEVYLPMSGQDPRPWPYQLIDRFTARTGRPMVPPPWAFGPRRRVGRNSRVGDRPEIAVMREQDLAVTAVDDAVHFYPAGSHVGQEAALREWTEQARQMGYRVSAYYNSFLDRDAQGQFAGWVEQGRSRGYYLTLADGTYPDLRILTGNRAPALYLLDFTNPAAVAWYGESFRWALELGYSGWMYDFGEYVPAAAQAADGQTGESLHNAYPVLYAKALSQSPAIASRGGDWLAFMRSGYTGSSAHVPFVWSGDPAASFEDSDGLPSMIPAGVNLGISGVPHFGSDIGGYHCLADGTRAADEELLARWIQFGALTPNMMDQSACVGGMASKKATLWTAPQALLAWRKYGRLHTRLFPYLYTLSREAGLTGAPLMRQPFLEHPEHRPLADIDDAYYLGPALYVVPVLSRHARAVQPLLPPGRFLDWETGGLVEGAAEVPYRASLQAPLERIPILLKEGQILPLLDDRIDTLADEQNADVIGPSDVADVYDVVVFLGAGARAHSRLWDGTELEAVRLPGSALTRAQGDRSALELVARSAGLRATSDPESLRTCEECFVLEALDRGLWRLRLSTHQRRVEWMDLQLTARATRRIRWDIYLAP